MLKKNKKTNAVSTISRILNKDIKKKIQMKKIPLKKKKTNQKPADWFWQMWKYSTNHPTPVANKKADNQSFKYQSTKLCITKVFSNISF